MPMYVFSFLLKLGGREGGANEDQKWRKLKCIGFVVCICAIFGAIETGLVFALKVYISSNSVIRDADINIGRVRAWKALARHFNGRSLYCSSLGWCA
jgi:hypothetical protein